MKSGPSILIALLLSVSLPAAASAPNLQSDSEVSSAGYYRLSWETDVKSDFVLQESTDSSFSRSTVLYQGPDTATLISGRADGTYYYRIRSDQNDNDWSNVAKVEVAHHSLSKAFMFFTLGAIVFIATLVVVILGSKTHKQ